MKFALSLALLCAVAALTAAGLFLASPSAQAADEAKPLKVLLVLGGCCHDYEKQKDVLKEGIEKRANAQVTIAYDPDKGTKHLNPAYEAEDWANGYDVVLHDECSADVKDLAIVDRILKPHREGLPAVAIHCAMHSFRTDGWNKAGSPTPWQELLGMQTTGHGPQKPIDISYVDSAHPVTKGLENWTTINEELYNNLGEMLPTAHVLARGKQGDQDKVITWVNTYNGKTRVFATTLGHNTATVADARYLDLVTRGLLWTCGKLNDDGTPAAGYGPKSE